MLRLVKLSPDLVGTTSASILAYLLVAAKKFIVALPKKHGMHVFWTWAPFFWTCTCFLDLTRIFFGPRVTKNVGDLPMCFLDPVGIFFVDLHEFVLDPRNFFCDSQINCFWARSLFFGPVHLLRGPCLHRVGGTGGGDFRRPRWNQI